MISATLCFGIFIGLELVFCVVVYLLLSKVRKTKVMSRSRELMLYLLVICMAMVSLALAYSNWKPVSIVLIEDNGTMTPSHNRYFLITDITTEDGVNISSGDDYYYICNKTTFKLVLQKYTYGYRGDNYSSYILPKKTMRVPELPDIYFDIAPSMIRTEKGKGKLTRWTLNVVK